LRNRRTKSIRRGTERKGTREIVVLIQRIAEKEGIQVSQDEVLKRVQSLAMAYQIPLEKFLKDLQKRNGVVELYDQIAHEKCSRSSNKTQNRGSPCGHRESRGTGVRRKLDCGA